MGKLKITEKMQELSQGSENRSATARLRDIFEDIEIALTAGVKREAIWEALKKEGYEMPLKTFESAIYRIKNKKGKKKQQPHSGQSEAKIKSEVKNTDERQAGEEIARPPGITDFGWSEMKAKARAEKRKQKLNSGE